MEQLNMIIKPDEEGKTLFWGVTNGRITIYRVPNENLTIDELDDIGNKHYLGEEWGYFKSLNIRTITEEMLETKDWDD